MSFKVGRYLELGTCLLLNLRSWTLVCLFFPCPLMGEKTRKNISLRLVLMLIILAHILDE